MVKPDITIKQLCQAFVYMRQQGATPDFALQELRKLRPTISPEERETLVGFVRHWEGTEGSAYPAQPNASIKAWHPVQNKEFQKNLDISKEHIERGTRQLSVAQVNEARNSGNIEALIFLVKGFENNPITFKLDKRTEIVLGRASDDNILIPDLDLSPYQATELGVSRAHATLTYEDGVLTIADMGSANNTFLNGVQIHPREIRIVNEGAELRLGKLQLRVVFNR